MAATSGTAVPLEAPAAGSGFRRAMRNPAVRAGLGVLSPLLAMAVLAPVITPADPLAPSGAALEPPTWAHPFGTDRLGRDLLSRVVAGARLSIGTAVLVSALVAAIGIVVGVISGYLGGVVDFAVSRILEIVLAFPGLLLALFLAGLLGPGLRNIAIALSLVGWVGPARLVRALVLAMRDQPFVEAARAAGCGQTRILVRHILPHILSPVFVLATLDVGAIILTVAALSFLGLGPPVPTPEWGAMLNEARESFFTSPHVMLFPGAAITLTGLGFNLLGDGLRDVLDPRM